MAKHGMEKSLKRLNAPSKLILPRKDRVWLAKPRAGTHRRSESIALVSLLRDLLKIADTAREADTIIKAGKVMVDGRVIKDPKFPVGFMDVVYIPAVDITYYLDLDDNGKLVARRDNRKHKYLKITGKRTVNNGKRQFSFDDGRSLLQDAGYKVGDTLKLSIPDFKVIGHYPMEVGSKCVVTGGKHAGEHGKIAGIIPGTPESRAKVEIKTDDGKNFITVKDYIFVVES